MFSLDTHKQKKLKDDIFEFFIIFSRFEFALKESGFLVDKSNAEASWDKFVSQYKDEFTVDEKIKSSYEYLTSAETRPNRQKTRKNTENPDEISTYWDTLNLDTNSPELKKATDVIKVIRNNLFHGGKYGDKTWSDLERTSLLVTHSVTMLLSIVNLDEHLQVYFENYA